MYRARPTDRKSSVDARARFTHVMDVASLKSFRWTALDVARCYIVETRGETQGVAEEMVGTRDTKRETSAYDQRNVSRHEREPPDDRGSRNECGDVKRRRAKRGGNDESANITDIADALKRISLGSSLARPHERGNIKDIRGVKEIRQCRIFVTGGCKTPPGDFSYTTCVVLNSTCSRRA
ncbi:uncharacterized protein LOC126858503 [Cataglyphis hispanica]|uniref:uncharacterized protein LOC126858503 n=1 Tax=Cataglyphis hispanica TaxID=1086592 RepID=UPI00217FF14D|nr:uncharacterized protein LOC126858503 [Cataglyphis hispanica]